MEVTGVTSQMQGSWQAREVGVGLSVCHSALSVRHLSLNRSGMQLGHQDFRKLPNNPNSQPRSRVLSLESPQVTPQVACYFSDVICHGAKECPTKTEVHLSSVLFEKMLRPVFLPITAVLI